MDCRTVLDFGLKEPLTAKACWLFRTWMRWNLLHRRRLWVCVALLPGFRGQPVQAARLTGAATVLEESGLFLREDREELPVIDPPLQGRGDHDFDFA
jgi:hypothetical protein